MADVVPGAISPDGRLLSYTDWSTGDLAVRDLATGESRRLTDKGSWLSSAEFAEAVQAISRDGTQIAYAWHLGSSCDLRVIDFEGREERTIYRNEQVRCITPQDWSPDGQLVLVTLRRTDGTGQTLLVSVADGSARSLPTVDSSSPNMSFSPDGHWILYDSPAAADAPERDVHLVSTDGSRRQRLVEHPADDFALGWDPDGGRVLFASDREGAFGVYGLWVDDGMAGGVPVLLAPDMPPIENSWVGLTRDGSYYYGRTAWESELYLVTLDAANGVIQPPDILVGHIGLDTSADWSPDGRFLAYALGRGRSPDPFVIAIRSVSTGEERRLPLGMKVDRLGGHAFQPHWSPDGRSLLVQGRSTLGDSFFRIDVETGDVISVLQGDGFGEWPVWSSDGQAIYYRLSANPYGEQTLMVKDLDTGREAELYRSDSRTTGDGKRPRNGTPSATLVPAHGGYVGASSLTVSPDGRWLAFVWSEGGEEGLTSTMLRVVSTAGGDEARELVRVSAPEWISQPAWMPDGRHLLFGWGRIEGQEPGFSLWRIPAEGGEPEDLGLSMEGQTIYGVSVNPDGRRIALTAGRDLGTQTWVMKGLLADARR